MQIDFHVNINTPQKKYLVIKLDIYIYDKLVFKMGDKNCEKNKIINN